MLKTNIAILVAIGIVLAGIACYFIATSVALVGIPPGTVECRWELPAELVDTNSAHTHWLFHAYPSEGDKAIEIRLDDVVVYRNRMPPELNEPPIQSLPPTRITSGVHELRITDLVTKETAVTNFNGGATEQIEVFFGPLRLWVQEEITGFYL